DLNDLYYVVKVVEHGGFTEVWRALGVPMSTLSRRIAALEAQYEVRQLQRTTRQVTAPEHERDLDDRSLGVMVGGGTLQGTDGEPQEGGEGVTQVQGLVTRSGKSNAQWFADMHTLVQQNDKVARNLFQMGTSIMQHTYEMAKRRQELQSEMSMSPTKQATPEITTHEPDLGTRPHAALLQHNPGKS
ncbi:LysR family transcriptional regulator, partial [Burkholderia thailandensis]|uniref:LysR family transcriptional regulator n=1 Tax=Burkholderia thailandensis TaxID=57975 RepID=UPI00217DE17E